MGNCYNQDGKTVPGPPTKQSSLSIKAQKNQEKNEVREEVKLQSLGPLSPKIVETVETKETAAFQAVYQPILSVVPVKKALGLDDFIMLNVIGKGAFGKVYRVKKKETGQLYQIYIDEIQKKQIIEHKLESNTVLERNVLKQSKHPFIVQLKLYFVMEYVSGGEFYKILQQTEALPENVVKFVTAEVVLALEYLNTKLKVIYRDLKPENILLTTQGHVKLTDFGLATLKKEDDQKTYTLAGTPEYLAPEIITRAGHSYEVDLWTLGILLFEMLSGNAPFTHIDRNVQKIQNLILENKVQYPLSMSSEAKDLISSLLKTNPKERLGVKVFHFHRHIFIKGYQDIKNHPFFSQIKWDDMFQLKIKSPLKNFAETNSQKQPKKTAPEREIPESPSNWNKNIPGITYNPDLPGGAETFNSIKLE